MTKAIQTFKETKEHYDGIVQAIVKELTDLQVQLAQARGKYEDLVVQEVEGKVKKETVTKARKQIEDLKEAIAQAEERRDIAQRIRNDKLQAIFPDVAREYIQYQQEIYDKQLAEAQELKKLRCQVLLKAKELHDIGRECRNLYQEISNIAMELGTEFKVRYNTPSLPMTANFNGVFQPLVALPNEVIEAYKLGKVPAFVRYFELTRKLIPEDLASQKLAELKK